jgi:hypothetical protein
MVGPFLTTTGKKKGPEKFKSAAHKQRAEEAAEAWEDLQKRYGVDAGKVDRAMKAKPYVAPQPYRRDTGPRIESKPDTIAVALKAPDKVYTGTEMIGIGQLHKSNAVPVFKQSDAEDISKMRRG